ncbi:MAG TPA: phosphatase PAP2 family protein [Lacibacter sp.]|nr:phosphatase PAP2 family protein [Lacibacter sp.]HMO89607.1 phosphatase PAP2 family protein [Lacibacter sp.]HMP86061.1 phosphatase PAP2 family protein [Lacibacter sp.]
MLKSILDTDRSLFHLLNQTWSHPWLDAVLPFFRNQFFWAPVYLFLLIFSLLYYKKQALWWIAFFLVTFAITDMVSTQLIKAVIQRPRPCWDGVTASTARMLIPCSHAYSFVSSHAANHFGMAMFLYGTLHAVAGRWIWLAFAWAALVCYAQVYVGAHFPLDVTGGALLGLLVGKLTAGRFKRLYESPAGSFR